MDQKAEIARQVRMLSQQYEHHGLPNDDLIKALEASVMNDILAESTVRQQHQPQQQQEDPDADVEVKLKRVNLSSKQAYCLKCKGFRALQSEDGLELCKICNGHGFRQKYG
jgi:hypothetical protein